VTYEYLHILSYYFINIYLSPFIIIFRFVKFVSSYSAPKQGAVWLNSRKGRS